MPGLEWDVRTTVEHLVDVIGFYILHVLASSPDRLRIDVVSHPGLDHGELVMILAADVRGLATAARLLPPDTEAFHFHGTADVSGFVALASSELLVHGREALHGLGRELTPRPDLAAKVLSRLFPSAPLEPDPWTTLFWATGRQSIEGRADVGPDWTYRTSPR